MPSVLLLFVSAWTAMFMGCISNRPAQQIAGAVVRQVVADATDLGVSATAFRLETKRWPKVYAELSAFVQGSAGKFQLAQYDRVEFLELPDGGLEIYGIAPGRTNRTTLTVNEADQK